MEMEDEQICAPSPIGLFLHLSCLCNFCRSCLLVFRQAQAPQYRPAAGDVRGQEQSLPGHGIVSPFLSFFFYLSFFSYSLMAYRMGSSYSPIRWYNKQTKRDRCT